MNTFYHISGEGSLSETTPHYPVLESINGQVRVGTDALVFMAPDMKAIWYWKERLEEERGVQYSHLYEVIVNAEEIPLFCIDINGKEVTWTPQCPRWLVNEVWTTQSLPCREIEWK